MVGAPRLTAPDNQGHMLDLWIPNSQYPNLRDQLRKNMLYLDVLVHVNDLIHDFHEPPRKKTDIHPSSNTVQHFVHDRLLDKQRWFKKGIWLCRDNQNEYRKHLLLLDLSPDSEPDSFRHLPLLSVPGHPHQQSTDSMQGELQGHTGHSKRRHHNVDRVVKLWLLQ